MITMLIDEIKNIKEDKETLRKFGVTVGSVLLAIGIILFIPGKASYVYFGAVGILLILFGLVYPVILKPFNKIWMALAVILGWFSSRVILILLFYLMFMPLGFFLRISGKDFLKLRYDKNAKTYWEKRKKTKRELIEYERQF